MNDPLKVLIADDNEHAREAMRDIVESNGLFEVIGEAKTGMEAINLTGELMPDIILMDIQMPEIDGLEATKEIKNLYPYVKIIIVTVSDEITHLFEALKKGAQGYLLKNIQPSAWHDYLNSVARDEVPMSEEIAYRILRELSIKRENLHTKDESPLSNREQEVLQLVARGHTNKQISSELIISEYTVKNHLKNILQKLHLENRVQLARYAYEHGWLGK